MLRLGAVTVGGLAVGVHAQGGRLPGGQEWAGNIGMDVLSRALLVLPPEPADYLYLALSLSKN